MATRPEFNSAPEQPDPVGGAHGDPQTVVTSEGDVRVSCGCGWSSDPVPIGAARDVWIEHVMERQFARDAAAWNGATPAEDVLERLRSGFESEC